MDLIIVESPTKAKTIGKFVGKDFVVESSYGHIRDLPKSKIGIDVAHDFEPSYTIPKKAEPVVANLKALAKKANRVILATDADAHRIRIGDNGKHVSTRWRGKLVGVGDRLQAHGRSGINEVKVPARHLLGDGGGGGNISLGVVPVDNNPAAVFVTARLEGREHSLNAIVKRCDRSLLHDCDLEGSCHFCADRVVVAGVEIGKKQQSCRRRDQ